MKEPDHGLLHNKLWMARIIWLLDNVWCNKNYGQNVYPIPLFNEGNIKMEIS